MATRLSKGTLVRINESWAKWNLGEISKRSIWQVGTLARVVGHVGQSHELYWLMADGHNTRVVWHRDFLEVVEGQ